MLQRMADKVCDTYKIPRVKICIADLTCIDTISNNPPESCKGLYINHELISKCIKICERHRNARGLSQWQELQTVFYLDSPAIYISPHATIPICTLMHELAHHIDYHHRGNCHHDEIFTLILGTLCIEGWCKA